MKKCGDCTGLKNGIYYYQRKSHYELASTGVFECMEESFLSGFIGNEE